MDWIDFFNDRRPTEPGWYLTQERYKGEESETWNYWHGTWWSDPIGSITHYRDTCHDEIPVDLLKEELYEIDQNIDYDEGNYYCG